MVVSVICVQSQYVFLSSALSNDLGIYQTGQSQKGFGLLFEKAQKESPCIIYLNELDKIIPKKDARKDTQLPKTP